MPDHQWIEGECADLLTRSGAGWNYRPGDSAMLAAVINNIVGDPMVVARARDCARELFNTTFDPAVSKARYIALLDTLAQGRGNTVQSSP